MDFTLKKYTILLETLARQGYTFQTYAGFLEHPAVRCIILRHDVEARYPNARRLAQIQHEMNIHGTYYFRFLPGHFDTGIISEIAEMGHEIGYHYDDLSHCKGDYENALRRFEKNLATLREIAPVKTICMEGAPLSKWDNRDLWSFEKSSVINLQLENTAHRSPLTAHYSDYGIIGEPYFDTDFSKVFYLTDTGRRWDGKGSVRDKVGQLDSWQLDNNSKFKIQNLKLNSTRDIISAANTGLLADQVMITFHPQRWTDKPLPWLKELVMQNVKNFAKQIVLSHKS